MLIFEEHFQDNRHKWATKDSEECYLCIEANQYMFEHKRSGNCWWLTWQSTDFFYDKKEFHIHVVLEKIAGELNHGYGFVWGLSDTRNFFEFVISDTGYYRIVKYDDGNFKDIVAWKRSFGIRKPNTVNVLEIRRQEATVEFYINSTLQEKLPADTLTQVKDGKFGFVIYDKMKIKVHSLIVSAENAETNSYKSNTSRNDAATQASFLKHEPPVGDTLEKVFADLNALIGLDRPKQQLLSLANFLKVQTERKKRRLKTADTTLHLVLYGSPGTGKTTVARLVGRLYKQLGCLQHGHVVETDRAGIIGGYIGQTALRVADAVDSALEGVLFIDEAYALVPKGGSSNDFGHEAVQALLKRMEDHRNELAVIVAGYPEEMEYFIASNPGLQSRFSRLFYFEDYTPSELVLIFGKFCYDHGYTMDISARIALQKIFETAYAKRDKNFGNGRFVRTVFERSIEKQANRIANCMKEMDDSKISLMIAEDLENL
ncbi:AAA family ATPase [Scytonema sp. UIC 10036]|uniref:AAA family ATPase n=1 Tax=Scytonema sp. UIC 10036 TaxID=2304196 RepID=UPI0012DA88B5|nr:AAA family ATPase [Scytonema sp. UIC 10036]MUG93227.1 AAA family ATPase [Scytonema sp. UIC 10036]